MKVFFVTALFVGATYALPSRQDDNEGCATCIKGTKMLMDTLNSEESLDIQMKILIEDACPEFEEGCDKGVMKWWPMIGHALYPAPELTQGICAYLNETCAMDPKAWDCNTCTMRLADVGKAMMAGTEKITAALAGEKFCMDPMNNFNEEQKDACQKAIEAFMPVAIKVITQAIDKNDKDVCNKVYDNICMSKSFYF